ncbi:hypothetical protein ABEW24_19390, partial [Paenibacillus jamilae]|uniref:hypothetical protein n=1 Tax=Paenibacillus jamilae TaxID=114136 RepID=UPI003D280D05
MTNVAFPHDSQKKILTTVNYWTKIVNDYKILEFLCEGWLWHEAYTYDSSRIRQIPPTRRIEF